MKASCQARSSMSPFPYGDQKSRMPSCPSPTRTPAARNAAIGSGSVVPGATVVRAMSFLGEHLDERPLSSTRRRTTGRRRG